MSKQTAKLGAYTLGCHDVLSDEHMKEICESCDPQELAAAIMERGGPFSARDAQALSRFFKNDDFDTSGDVWEDEVLDKYAEYVNNYEYTYKPEAQEIDSSIDPNETHIGIMAQDIEKVNPACIKETPEGIKTVDTGRLALMNAGAIADLAREVRDIKNG